MAGFMKYVAAGLAGGAESMVNDLTAQIAEERALALDEIKRDRNFADKTRELDEIETRQKKQSGLINARAEELASSRFVDDPEQASLAEKRLDLANQGMARGDVTREQMDTALTEESKMAQERAKADKPNTTDYLKAKAEMTGDWREMSSAEDRKEAREDRLSRDEQARIDRKDTNERIERHHQENLDWQKEKFGEKVAADKLPEATKVQVSSLFRMNEKLESRYYSLKPTDFNSQEEYTAERDGLRNQIDANSEKINTLLGGEPPRSKADLFPARGDAPKKVDGGAPARPAVTAENKQQTIEVLRRDIAKIEAMPPAQLYNKRTFQYLQELKGRLASLESR